MTTATCINISFCLFLIVYGLVSIRDPETIIGMFLRDRLKRKGLSITDPELYQKRIRIGGWICLVLGVVFLTFFILLSLNVIE